MTRNRHCLLTVVSLALAMTWSLESIQFLVSMDFQHSRKCSNGIKMIIKCAILRLAGSNNDAKDVKNENDIELSKEEKGQLTCSDIRPGIELLEYAAPQGASQQGSSATSL